MAHGPLKKPSKAHLPLMVFLADHPEILFVSSSSGLHSSYHFAYQNGSRVRDSMETPEVKKSMAFHRLLQSGWFVNVERKCKLDDKDNPDNHWAWYDHPYRITKAGIAMANAHRATYEENLRKEAEARAAVERYIVVSNQGKYGSRRRYAALCRVTRETEKRIYVEQVSLESEGRKPYDDWVPSIEGHGNNKYVSRDKVVADGVTIAEYEAMRRVESAHIAWKADLKSQEDAELEEIRARYRQRREQNEMCFEDELREALEAARKEKPDVPQDTD